MRWLLAVLLAISLHANTLVVVGHFEKAHRLKRSQILAIYLLRRTTWMGRRLIPINLPIDDPIRKRFEEKVLHRSRAALMREWRAAYYQGYKPPKVLASQKAVALFVRSVPGAIGYLDRSLAQRYGLTILYEVKE